MSITALCSSSDVQKILSSVGLSLRIDDDATATTWAIEEASVDVYGFAALQYEEADLVASNWITRIAARLAAWYVCIRRGNPVPKSIDRIKESAWEQLEQVETGKKKIPDAPMRKELAPVLSNLRVKMRPFPRTQVEVNRSTGTAEGYVRFVDQTDTLDYSI